MAHDDLRFVQVPAAKTSLSHGDPTRPVHRYPERGSPRGQRHVGGSRFVTVPAGQDRVDLRLPEVGQIEVEVDAPAGVAGLAVSAHRTGVDDAGLRVWALDRLAGQMVFRGQVSPGSYVVRAGPPHTLTPGGKADTERSNDVNVTVQPGQTQRVRIALTDGAAPPAR